MSAGPRVVAAIGLGYLLGRTRKMRLALMIAAAGATGKFRGGPRELLTQGYQRLAESPELSKITESLRGELLGAAKAAAVATATNRIESLNSRLQDQVNPSGKHRQEDADQEEPEDQDGSDARDLDDEDDLEGDNRDDELDEDGEDGEVDEEEEPEEDTSRKRPSRNSRRPARAGSGRAPVRRARR